MTPCLFLCTEYNGTPYAASDEIKDPEFISLGELELLSPSLFQPFKDGVEKVVKFLTGESVFPFISENPIDKSVFSSIIKSKELTNADYGKKGMKWGVHKMSAYGKNKPCTGFKNARSAKSHRKHLKEFPGITFDDYEKAGNEFLSQECGMT